MAFIVGRDAPSQDALRDVAVAVLSEARLAVAARPVAALDRAGGGCNHRAVSAYKRSRRTWSPRAAGGVPSDFNPT